MIDLNRTNIACLSTVFGSSIKNTIPGNSTNKVELAEVGVFEFCFPWGNPTQHFPTFEPLNTAIDISELYVNPKTGFRDSYIKEAPSGYWSFEVGG